MANMANLLVKDDAGTPTEFTFEPVTDNPSPIWRTSIAGVPFNGQHRMTLSEEALKSGDYKRQMKVELTVMETLGASGTSSGYVAPPKSAYNEVMYITHISSSRSTKADRANLVKIAVGFLQGASAVTATGTLSQAAAGSAFGNSTAPVTLFFVSGVLPN